MLRCSGDTYTANPLNPTNPSLTHPKHKQEFAGALLMFLVLWPFVGVFGNTWTAWIAHFFFVMLVRTYVLSHPSKSMRGTVLTPSPPRKPL